MNIHKCPPVLIVGFNRPQYLSQVFSVVRQAMPSKLFLALDAPRAGKPKDVPGFEECKKIFSSVDWPCDVERNYASSNMGCRDRMTSAISWAFNAVEELVILEDDVVPDITFFPFCSEMLERYKNDTRVAMVAGHDEHLHLHKIKTYGDSYYFDRMATISGWATWRRAWRLYDNDMKCWPELSTRFELFNEIFKSDSYCKRRKDYTWKLFRREAGAWAGNWVTTLYKENMLCIHPYVNLMSHIGVESARAGGRRSPFDNRTRVPMQFPLCHPLLMIPRSDCEHYYLHDECGVDFTIWEHMIRFSKRVVSFIMRRILFLR